MINVALKWFCKKYKISATGTNKIIGNKNPGTNFFILFVSFMSAKYAAKNIIMKSYGRKVDAKVQYVPETK